MYNSSTCNEKWKANVEDQMAVDVGSPPRLLVQSKKLRICWLGKLGARET